MSVEPSAQFSSYAQDPMIMHPYWMPPYQELKNMYTPELFDFNKFSSPPYLDAEYLDAAQNVHNSASTRRAWLRASGTIIPNLCSTLSQTLTCLTTTAKKIRTTTKAPQKSTMSLNSCHTKMWKLFQTVTIWFRCRFISRLSTMKRTEMSTDLRDFAKKSSRMNQKSRLFHRDWTFRKWDWC